MQKVKPKLILGNIKEEKLTKMKKIIFITISVAILVATCDKNKRASKRLMKPGTWKVIEFSVDGQNLTPIQVILNVQKS